MLDPEVKTQLLKEMDSYLQFNLSQLDENSLMIIRERLDSKQSDKFLACFSLLKDARIFDSQDGLEHFLELIQHKHITNLFDTLKTFTGMKLSFRLSAKAARDIRCLIIRHPSVHSINIAFNQLVDCNLVIPGEFLERVLTIVLNHNTPIEVSTSVAVLLKNNILTNKHLDLISQHPNPTLLATQLSEPQFYKTIFSSEASNELSSSTQSFNSSLRKFAQLFGPPVTFNKEMSLPELLSQLNPSLSKKA